MIQRARLLKVLLVAANACGAQADELAAGGPAVAIVALQHCVGAEQWEAIQVAPNRIHIRPPAVHRVTILARGAELAAMDIGVAVGALFTNASKNLSHMAGITRDILVQAPQWILGFAIVVELNRLPEGRPTRGCVTVLAGDGQRPVRIPHPRWRAGLSNQPAGA